MTKPLISIITINYNNKSGLEKTILSVVNQTYTAYEYIIIDGNSTDGSKEVIESYKDRLAYFVSERDTGIFDAMNKGITAAKGTYLLFLNSGDYLVSENVLVKTENYLGEDDIVYGNIFQDVRGRLVETIFPETITAKFFYTHSFSHQATFIKKELFQKYGYYNADYKIVSDWEFFFVAVCKHNCSIKYMPEMISVFNLTGISHSKNHEILRKRERALVFDTNFKHYNADYNRLMKIETIVCYPYRLFKRAYRFVCRIFNVNKVYLKDI